MWKVCEMGMKKQICLTEDDIRQIISNAFDVDKNKVNLETYTDIEGYGTGEHRVTRLKATVEVPMNRELLAERSAK